VTSFADSLPLSNQEALDTVATASGHPGSSASASPNFNAPTVSVTAFPAGITAGKSFYMDKSGVKTVAGAVGQDEGDVNNGLNTLNSAGVLASTIGVGWPTVDNLSVNAGNAYYAISAFTQRLATGYGDMAGSLHTAVGTVSDADEKAASQARQAITIIERG
jgi:hypothetical protein